MRKWIGILLLGCGLGPALSAQVGLQLPAREVPSFNFAPNYLFGESADILGASLPPTTEQPTRLSPAAYRYQDLAFFCKVEVKLEHAAQMPVKFRLGSVQYVDQLEGYR